MSFPRYPSYKDSGVEWLGEVPVHWSVEPFKRQIDRNDGGVWGDDPDGANDTIVLRSTEQTVDGHWKLDDPAPRKLSESEIGGSLLAENDLLLTKSSGSSLHIGKTTLVTAEIAAMRCCYSNFMQRIRLKPTFLPKLAWHIMNNDLARLQFDLLSNSSTGLANLNATMVGQIVLPVPPIPEQTQIAAFLDHETAKIDELVAEQRRLMELLKEKRQAVISHAVTQGLNPDAPMKPSGIEWLGDVPAHWEVWPLGRTASDIDSLFIDGDWIESKDLSDVGIRYLTSGNVGEGIYKEQGQGFISQTTFDELNCIEVLPGDVLISRLNLPIGRACIVPDLDSRIVTCVDNVIVRPNRNFDRRFFVFLLTSKAHFANMEILARGTTMQRISRSTLAHVRFAFPPETEQTQIAAFLDSESAKFDALTTAAQRAIDLLQERRTALISAAVTGQIDVRPH